MNRRLVFLSFVCGLMIGSSTGFKFSKSMSDWTFTLYTNNNTITGTTNLSEANPSVRTVVIIHGWQQRGTLRWIILMKDTYLSKFLINVIILDWSKDANMLYGAAVRAVPKVGDHLANSINEWKNSDIIEINTLKVIGFSLGAHIAGYAGQHYRILSNGTNLPNIVGIEAAGPDFNFKPNNQRLDESDADMVQGIHTSSTGMTSRYGKVDVYYNTNAGGCGIKQLGCPGNPGVPVDSLLGLALCDHIRSVAYFIESIESNDFLAVPCTCSEFKADTCGESSIIVGEHLSSTAARGEYYLITACESPFALGTAGLHPASYRC